MGYIQPHMQPVDDVIAEFEHQQEAVYDSRTAKVYSPIQAHFLARLRRLDGVRSQLGSLPAHDPFMKKLVDRGLFATYRECVDEGVGPEARQILNI